MWRGGANAECIYGAPGTKCTHAHTLFFPLTPSFGPCARLLLLPPTKPFLRGLAVAPSPCPLARSRCAAPLVPLHAPLGVARLTAVRNLMRTPISRRGLNAGLLHAKTLHIPAVWMLTLYARGGPMGCLRSWWLGWCVGGWVSRVWGRVRNAVEALRPLYLA